MSEKQTRFLKIFVIAIFAGIFTLVFAVVYNNWGKGLEEIPEDASEWKEPENEEVAEKVDEIAERIMSGGDYSFSELIYILDHDSETGQEIIDYLVEQGVELSKLESAGDETESTASES